MKPALRPLAPDLWVVERPLGNPAVEIGTRMTVIRLKSGGPFLHSPVKLDAELRDGLAALGPVACVVCPNRQHHLFAGEYLGAFPNARLYGAPGLAAKRRDLDFAEPLSNTAPEVWRGELEQHLFAGIPILNEVVFLHPATRTLLFTDLAFNVPADGIRGAQVFIRLSGAARRFGPHRFVRWFMVRDRSAALESRDRIQRWDFERVIVTHGDVLERGGREAVGSEFSFLG